MRDVKQEITKEMFEDYLAMSRRDRTVAMRKNIPAEWKYGCGYYGNWLHKEKDRYYIVHTIGGSND